MINIPLEVIFDVLQKNECKFYSRNDYKTYIIRIMDDDIYDVIEDEEEKDYDNPIINIKKSSFMELLLNRVYICSEFELKLAI